MYTVLKCLILKGNFEIHLSNKINYNYNWFFFSHLPES